MASLALEKALPKDDGERSTITQNSAATTIADKKEMQKQQRLARRLRKVYAMTEIMLMFVEGCSNQQMMDTLGLPRRTFFRYVSETFEEDIEILQKQNEGTLALELSVLKDRLTTVYRNLMGIANSKGDIMTRDRINAMAAACEVVLAIFKLQIQGPMVIKHLKQMLL